VGHLFNGTEEASHGVKRTPESKVAHVSVVQWDARISLAGDGA
jgi:hypothetical protein